MLRSTTLGSPGGDGWTAKSCEMDQASSLLIHQGESPKFIQAQLGHSSIETTFDLYGHLFPEAYEGAANRLQAALFGSDRPTIDPQTETASGEVAKGRVTLAVSSPAGPRGGVGEAGVEPAASPV